MGFKDAIAGANIPDAPKESNREPRLYWRNGVKQARTPGFWYVKAEDQTTPPAAPWKATDRYDGEDGYEAEALRVAPIGYRSQPFRTTGEGPAKRTIWCDKWAPGMSIYTEVLCYVEGLTGVQILTCKGMTGKAIMDIFAEAKKTLRAYASKVAGKQLPAWAFWLPMSQLRDAKGGVVYSDTGHGSFTTAPALLLPGDDMDACASALYTGDAILAAGSREYMDRADWLKARRGNDGDDAPQVTNSAAPAVNTAGEAEFGKRSNTTVVKAPNFTPPRPGASTPPRAPAAAGGDEPPF